MSTEGTVLGVLLLVGFWLARSYVYVAEGEVAVLTRFGKAVRNGEGGLHLLLPGLHRKLPWDRVLRVCIKEQSIELTGDEDRTVMTNDGIAIRYQSALRFAPLNDQLENYLFGLARPMEHMVGTFTCLLRNEIANFRIPVRETSQLVPQANNAEQLIDESLGAYALIRRERRTLNQRVTDCGKRLVGDHFGVRLEAIDVTDFEPPDELREALHTVVQAKNDVDAALFRSEGECQQRLLAAQRGVQIAQERARAIEVEMVDLGSHLAELEDNQVLDEYVERRRAEVLLEARQVYVRGAAEQKVNP
jgi:regulator of protease activity HflC (stomatin/prohibitin superfamily)